MAELKDERQECKKLKGDLQHCQDDLAESRSEKERYEKILTEFKQRARAKKSEWDEEMEELRQSHEQEMQQLKERYRKEKSSSSIAVSDQLAQVERERERERALEWMETGCFISCVCGVTSVNVTSVNVIHVSTMCVYVRYMCVCVCNTCNG